MDIRKIDANLVLLRDDDYKYSFYEYVAGKLKESNAFFRSEDAIELFSNVAYITPLNGCLYVYWKENLSLWVHKFVRLISKSSTKVYLEDEEGSIWILAVVPLDPDGDIRDMVWVLQKKGAS